MSQNKYQLLALGGTFDHFHIGHQKFINFSANLAKHLIVGLTNQQMAMTKPYSQTIQKYDQRKSALIKYFSASHIDYQLITLQDVFGTTLTNNQIQALAVTTETQAGVKLINHQRQILGLKPLPVHVCRFANDELGQPIHSQRIRSGEINRQGKVYSRLFNRDLVLSASQISELKKFRANLVSNISPSDNQLIAVVGDATLSRFILEKKQFHLAVYDQKTQRQILSNRIKPHHRATNPAGQISLELSSILRMAVNHAIIKLDQKQIASQLICVDGEEDLATVALALLLPLGSIIYYGQPNEGLMKLTVTEKTKDYFYQLLS